MQSSNAVSPLIADSALQSALAASPLKSDAGEIIIQTRDLNKTYRAAFARTGKTALHGLTIDVKRGEIFGLVGPNGSGKTTTMKLLLGLIKPNSGTLEIFGRGPRDVAVKQRIGFLPDGPYFYDHLNSYEVLDFYGKLFGFSKEYRRQRSEEILDMVGLNKADRMRVIRTYSKGMMQRVGLAQALLNDPELLFLDEPTTGLDPIGARQMKDAILAVRDSGKTVLLCSHLLADVQAICDRVAILSEGNLVKFGTVPELVGPSQHFEIFAEGFGDVALDRAHGMQIPFVKENGQVKFEADSSEQLQKILSFISDSKARTLDVKGYSETLEDVFVRSVKSDGR
ncbi:ABC-2 type transport system ATP-binding protein [Abditibacterium utsteinense]|uniref:ABC-2 type transport system ATP-binding protein n=1 Tax=Abditibacterium utsteinense TaxID=1960156 RepID=A0A2S8SW12_9BACT|nr:ABC transporter ATP-binding protein [Abditibacterium utsteinense]PQV64977.1 ABC-2 type transport system ATP-binding protein [Abditibacterium utsteinense]